MEDVNDGSLDRMIENISAETDILNYKHLHKADTSIRDVSLFVFVFLSYVILGVR